MLEITAGKLLDRNWDDVDTAHYDLYVVVEHENNLPLYVGRSTRSVIIRMMEHLGQGDVCGGFPSFPDALGLFILDRLPKSRNWIIRFYHQSEILPKSSARLIKGHSRDEWESTPFNSILPWDESMAVDKLWYNDLDWAEQKLIAKLRPCLNCVHNQNGQSIPMNILDPATYLGL